MAQRRLQAARDIDDQRPGARARRERRCRTQLRAGEVRVVTHLADRAVNPGGELERAALGRSQPQFLQGILDLPR